MRRRLAERVLAWLVTGPVGHLAAGVADWVELLVRWQWSRARARASARVRDLRRPWAAPTSEKERR